MTTRKLQLAVLMLVLLAGSAFSQDPIQSLFNDNSDLRPVKKTYNPETDTTRVGTASRQTGPLWLSAWFQHAGKKLTAAPEHAVLTFWARFDDEPNFKADHAVTLIADGTPIELAGSSWKTADKGERLPHLHVAGPKVESVEARILPEQVKIIAAAKQVEVRIGPYTYELDKGQRRSFARLAKEMAGPNGD